MNWPFLHYWQKKFNQLVSTALPLQHKISTQRRFWHQAIEHQRERNPVHKSCVEWYQTRFWVSKSNCDWTYAKKHLYDKRLSNRSPLTVTYFTQKYLWQTLIQTNADKCSVPSRNYSWLCRRVEGIIKKAKCSNRAIGCSEWVNCIDIPMRILSQIGEYFLQNSPEEN